MKKIIIVVIWTIFIAINNSIGQCPSGDIEFASQSQIDQFIQNYPNCTAINGNLRIKGAIKNLSALRNIRRVSDTLSIQVMSSLKDAVEINLPNLRSVGGAFICFQSQLKALRLGQLSTIGGSFLFFQNDALQILDFNSLNSIGGSFEFFQNFKSQANNTSLPIIGFNTLRTVGGNLDFTQNFSSTAMIGSNLFEVQFEALNFVGGDISFLQNHIRSISCNRLTAAQENLEILENSGLTNLSFDRLIRVEGSFVLNDTEISAVNTFQRLSEVGGTFQLINNKSLTDCSGFCHLLSAGSVRGDISVASNAVACDSAGAITAACTTFTTISLAYSFPSSLLATNIGPSSLYLLMGVVYLLVQFKISKSEEVDSIDNIYPIT